MKKEDAKTRLDFMGNNFINACAAHYSNTTSEQYRAWLKGQMEEMRRRLGDVGIRTSIPQLTIVRPAAEKPRFAPTADYKEMSDVPGTIKRMAQNIPDTEEQYRILLTIDSAIASLSILNKEPKDETVLNQMRSAMTMLEQWLTRLRDDNSISTLKEIKEKAERYKTLFNSLPKKGFTLPAQLLGKPDSLSAKFSEIFDKLSAHISAADSKPAKPFIDAMFRLIEDLKKKFDAKDYVSVVTLTNGVRGTFGTSQTLQSRRPGNEGNLVNAKLLDLEMIDNALVDANDLAKLAGEMNDILKGV